MLEKYKICTVGWMSEYILGLGGRQDQETRVQILDKLETIILTKYETKKRNKCVDW